MSTGAVRFINTVDLGIGSDIPHASSCVAQFAVRPIPRYKVSEILSKHNIVPMFFGEKCLGLIIGGGEEEVTETSRRARLIVKTRRFYSDFIAMQQSMQPTGRGAA